MLIAFQQDKRLKVESSLSRTHDDENELDRHTIYITEKYPITSSQGYLYKFDFLANTYTESLR